MRSELCCTVCCGWSRYQSCAANAIVRSQWTRSCQTKLPASPISCPGNENSLSSTLFVISGLVISDFRIGFGLRWVSFGKKKKTATSQVGWKYAANWHSSKQDCLGLIWVVDSQRHSVGAELCRIVFSRAYYSWIMQGSLKQTSQGTNKHPKLNSWVWKVKVV